jgi:hypothetical protein
MGKLGFHSRLETAAFARQNGIIEDLVRADSSMHPSSVAVR